MVDKSVLELYSKTAAGVETKLASSYLENAAEGWIYEYGAAHKTAIANGAFIMRRLQMEAMPGYTFEARVQSDHPTLPGREQGPGYLGFEP